MGKCYLCNSTEQDEIKYGEFITIDEMSVHYFCLLLSSNLMQRGKDDEGFLGFLVKDIKNEALRVEQTACFYCKKNGANIACCAQKCRRSFHLICGIRNDCENQFIHTFKSFCDRHVTGKKLRGPDKDESCAICYDDLREGQQRYNSVTMLQAPCCKNGWFHKWCLSSFAKSAGYFFRCPLCNDSKYFRQRLVYRGIFIPDRDASWELEPNAFSELLERPAICTAGECNARGGRTSSHSRNKLKFCLGCGSVAMHRCCIENKADNFYCNDCNETFAEVNDTTVVNMSHHTDSGEEEDVDICGEGDDESNINNIETETLEENVRPLGRNQNRRLPVSDDDGSSDVDITDTEDDIIRRSKHHVSRRVNRIHSIEENTSECSDEVKNPRVQGRCRRIGSVESSDSGNSIETVICEAKLRTSKNSDSFFDSGTGSDPSNSSADKSHLTDNFKIEINESTDNHQEKPIKRRFTSLNNEPKDGWCIAKRTRRQSMHADMKVCSEVPGISRKSRSRSYAGISYLTINSSTNIPLVSEEMSNNAAKIKNEIKLESEAKTIVAENTAKEYEVENIRKKITGRSRAQSEECPIAPSSTSVTQRRSSLQATSISIENPECFRLQSQKFLYGDGRSSKRSRSDSQSSTEFSLNKKQKSNSTLNENECNNSVPRTMRRSSRSRSPLGLNPSSINAFITPSYVKEKKSQSNRQKQDEDCLREEPLEPRIENIFKNRSNISNRKRTNQKLPIYTHGNSYISSELNNSQNNGVHKTFSCNILISSNKKRRSRRSIFQRLSDRNIPSNQTRIETFFKRILP